MYISQETNTEIEERLTTVLKTAKMTVFEPMYYFKEQPIDRFQFDPKALACVRDHEVWSYLVPAENEDSENFKVFSFHFQDGQDNSGFVGWLASKIKNELGSGVFVVCGQNSRRGGIFDYWGAPIEIGDQVLTFIEGLKSQGEH